MTRTTIALALLALATSSAAAQDVKTFGPVLKSTVSVTGDVVRIGDLVENAGLAANIAVFRAPDLGSTGTVPVERILEALRPHNVIGLDTRGVMDVNVTHLSRSIPAKEIEARIARELAGQFGQRDEKNIGITFDREPRTLQVESNITADLQIFRTSFDRRSGRFDVQIELPGSAVMKRVPLRLTGVAAEVYDATMVVRPLARGDVLRASDIVTERRPKSEMAADAVADAQAAIGQAAKRALRPGLPLRQGDLMRPELVQRNEPVMILYRVPGLSLTLRGKALDTGAEGDIVNVMNIQSKRTVQGVVSGPGQVTVSAPSGRIASNLTEPDAGER